MKKLNRIIEKYLIIAGAALFSAYIYAHVAEKIFFIDLPYISSVEKTDTPKIIEQVKTVTSAVPETQKYGFFGRPSLVRIPRLSYALDLQDTDPFKGKWTLSNTIGGIYTYSKNNAGLMGDSVIFSLPDTKLMDFTVLLVEGDRFTLDTTKGWRYTYKVINKITVPKDKGYLAENDGYKKLFLLKDVPSTHSVIVVEGEFLNVEEIS